MIVSKKITTQVILGIDTTRFDVPTVLQYTTEDPAVIVVEFYTQDAVSVWHLSRDVFVHAAINQKIAGECSFVLRPGRDKGVPVMVACMIPPDQPDKHMHIMFRTRDVQLFLYDTFDQVRLGEEDYSVQVDQAIYRIFAA